MSNLISMSGMVFQWILQTTYQAAVLTGLILLAQGLLGKRLSPTWRHGLWLLLVIRLLMPVVPQSAFSIFNLTRTVLSQHITANPSPVTFANGANGKTFQSAVPAVAGQNPASTFLQQPVVAAQSVWQIDWFDIALCVWLAGVVFFGARLIWIHARLRARIAAYRPVKDEKVTQLFKECCAAFNVTRSVRVIETEVMESPAVYGIWRKWLLLPDGSMERFSPDELRCIFLHELAHLKRGDLGVNWVVAVLQVLHWFNPVLWLAWARMRADREMATDALALLHVHKGNHVPYGETIIRVLEGLVHEQALPRLVGIVENKARLKERLEAISRPGKPWKWAALAVTMLIACIGLTSAQIGNGGTADSAGITGTWQATNVAFAPWTFNLKADGDTLTGTASQGQTEGASYGNMMTSLTVPTAIHDGVISGNNMSFKCVVGERTITFSGVVSGDTITFTRTVKVQPGAFPGMDGIYGAFGATNFLAQRVVVSTVSSTTESAPPISSQTDNGSVAESAGTTQPGATGITGTWQATNVAFAPWTFNLKADGDTLTGTVSQGQNEGASYGNMMTSLTGATAIYDGAISGNNMSFKCVMGGRTITFSGVVAGDTITFTRTVKVQPGAFPGMDGIYGASGATNFVAQRVASSAP